MSNVFCVRAEFGTYTNHLFYGGDVLSSLINIIISTRIESRILATRLDTLLPELISGEVRVIGGRMIERAAE